MRRVGEREVLEGAKAHGPVTNNDAIRRSCGCDSSWPLIRIGRPPGVVVVLVVADDLRARREPGLADQEDQAAGRREQRFDRQPLGLDGPFLLQLAGQRSDRVLARVDRAAGPERPHAGPARDPFRSPAGEPATLAVAHDAEDRERAIGVAGQPQRPAHLLQLERERVVVERRSARAARRCRRAPASRGPSAPRSRGRPRPTVQAAARRASRSSETSPGPAARDRARGFRADRTTRRLRVSWEP